jgi:proteasome component ECM29
MSALWIAVTGGGAEARASISKHLIVAIDALLIETSSKMWRIRAGACSALAEIIVGRDWESLGGGEAILNDDDLHSPSKVLAGVRLLRLWRVTMRALDDVRTNVRESGSTLARSVRGLTIRLCDPSSHEKDSGLKRERDGVARADSDIIAASATALRWLVRHGLNQHTEGTAFCITCLVEIVGLVTPRMLAPILPDLLRSLLVSISGLEPAALNYLQLRTDDQEGLERARLQLASTGPIASAVTKCLDLTPETSLETQHDVVVQLDNALRQSAGFATRSAIADAISALCSTCPAAFHFSGTNSSNPSVRLLRALYNASERERTAASRDRLIHSLGSLASVCPGVSVRSLALKAYQKYNSSTGGNDDPLARSAAAASLRSIAVRASNQLADGGKMDVWCRYILPSAFIGKKDDNKKVASQWQDVWDEAAPALRSSEVPLIGTTHEENLLSYLVEECIRGLDDVSWSRRTSASNALIELCDSGILAPLPKQTASTSMTAERQEYRAKQSHLALERCVLLVRKARLWTGKIVAATAASKIAGVWSVTFGYVGDVQSCPITFSSGSFDDLFQGDKWFLAARNESEIDDVETAQSQVIVSEGEENESDVEILRPVAELKLSSNAITFTGLCRLLLNSAENESMDKNAESLPYRKSCFDNMKYLLSQLSSNADITTQQTAFELLSPHLMTFIRNHSEFNQPPVLVAAAMACLESALYDGLADASLVELIAQAGGASQAAWTIREASAKCLARVAAVCHAECFRTYDFTSQLVSSAAFALTDKKFWQVRHGGLTILQKLVNRTGKASGTPETSRTLEALLPHKEAILQQVRACLKDPEARITALASDILSSMAWWP